MGEKEQPTRDLDLGRAHRWVRTEMGQGCREQGCRGTASFRKEPVWVLSLSTVPYGSSWVW